MLIVDFIFVIVCDLIITMLINMFSVAIIWIMFSLISSTISWSVDDGDPIVNTRYGQIRGRKESIIGYQNDLRVTSFIGIPYAAPPIGVRRFSVSPLINDN